MKARKRDSNDEWKDIDYVQLRDSYCLTSADQMEFQNYNLSTELKTYDQVHGDEHWKDVRERAAIAAMQGIINHGEMPDILIARAAVRYADELVKQLKGE